MDNDNNSKLQQNLQLEEQQLTYNSGSSNSNQKLNKSQKKKQKRKQKKLSSQQVNDFQEPNENVNINDDFNHNVTENQSIINATINNTQMQQQQQQHLQHSDFTVQDSVSEIVRFHHNDVHTSENNQHEESKRSGMTTFKSNNNNNKTNSMQLLISSPDQIREPNSLSRRQQIEQIIKSKTTIRQQQYPKLNDNSAKSFHFTSDYQNLVSFRMTEQQIEQNQKIQQSSNKQLLMSFQKGDQNNYIFVNDENQLIRQNKSDQRQHEQFNINNIPVNITTHQKQQRHDKNQKTKRQISRDLPLQQYYSNDNKLISTNNQKIVANDPLQNFLSIPHDKRFKTQQNNMLYSSNTQPLLNLQTMAQLANIDNIYENKEDSNVQYDKHNLSLTQIIKDNQNTQQQQQQQQQQTAQFNASKVISICDDSSKNSKLHNDALLEIKQSSNNQDNINAIISEDFNDDIFNAFQQFSKTPQPINEVEHDLTINQEQMMQQEEEENIDEENVMDSDVEDNNNDDGDDEFADHNQSPIRDETDNFNHLDIDEFEEHNSFDKSNSDQCNHIETQQQEEYKNLNDQQLLVRQDLKIKIDDSFNSEHQLQNQAQLIPASPVHTFGGNIEINNKNMKNKNDLNIYDKNRIIVQLQEFGSNLEYSKFNNINENDINNEMLPKPTNKNPIRPQLQQNNSHNTNNNNNVIMGTYSSQIRDESQGQMAHSNTHDYIISPGMKQQNVIFNDKEKYVTNPLTWDIDNSNVKLRMDVNDMRQDYQSKSCNISPMRQSPYHGTFIFNPAAIQTYSPIHNGRSINNNDSNLLKHSQIAQQSNTHSNPQLPLQQQRILSLQNKFNNTQIFTPSKIILNNHNINNDNQNNNNNFFPNRDSVLQQQISNEEFIQIKNENHTLRNEMFRMREQHSSIKNQFYSENQNLKKTIQIMKIKMSEMEYNLKQSQAEKAKMQKLIYELTLHNEVQDQKIIKLQQQIQQQQNQQQTNSALFLSPIKPSQHNSNYQHQEYRSRSTQPQHERFINNYSTSALQYQQNMKQHRPTDIRKKESPSKNQETISYRADDIIDEMISADDNKNDFTCFRKPRESIFNTTLRNNNLQDMLINSKEKQQIINNYINPEEDIDNDENYKTNNNNMGKNNLIINQMKRGVSVQENNSSNSQQKRNNSNNAKNISIGVTQALHWGSNDMNELNKFKSNEGIVVNPQQNYIRNRQFLSNKSFSPSRVEADEFDSNGCDSGDTNDQSLLVNNNLRRQSQDVHSPNNHNRKQSSNIKVYNVNQVRDIPIQRNKTLFQQSTSTGMNTILPINNNNNGSNYSRLLSQQQQQSNNYQPNNNFVSSYNYNHPINNNNNNINGTNSDNNNISPSVNYRSALSGNGVFDSNEVIDLINHNINESPVPIAAAVNFDNYHTDLDIKSLEQRRDELEREYSRYLGQQRSGINKQRQIDLEQEIENVTRSINQTRKSQNQKENGYLINQVR